MADESVAQEPRANRRKMREGTVVSNKMDKTVVVAVIDRVRHPRYFKTVQRTKRLYAHDADNGAGRRPGADPGDAAHVEAEALARGRSAREGSVTS